MTSDLTELLGDLRQIYEEFDCNGNEYLARAALAAHSHIEKASIEVDDLASLVRRLARALKMCSPDNTIAAQAVDYLDRHDLQGRVLR